MKAMMIFSVVLLAPFCAWAQDKTINRFCNQIPAYQSLGAADYKPGLDIYGKTVAPADINHSPSPIEYPLEIPVDVDVLRLLNASPPPILAQAGEMEARPGTLMLFEDGYVTYNGQTIGDRVAYLCGKRNPPQEGRQTPEAPLPSSKK